MNENNLKIKITNHLTGEIIEKEVSGGDAATNLYFELKASQKATEAALKQLTNFIDEWLGEDEEQRLGDGHVVKRTQRETKRWTSEGLRRVGFDDDQIAVMSTVNMTMAKEIISEAIERGEIKPDSKKLLDEAAERSVSKPFLVFK